jgi:RNA polymerase II subunit A-like phosphatase
MVVIIDDRADVWEWSPNLIKVVPCMFIRFASFMVVLSNISDDFFVGIGDINSTFLPKLEPLTAATSPRPVGSEPKEPPVEGGADSQNLPGASQTTTSEPGTTTPLSTTIPVPSDDGAERAQLAANAMLKQNNLALEAQLEERPLAKKQEALQEGDAAAHDHIQHNAENTPAAGVQANQEDSSTHKHEKRKALLKNDDYELQRVAKVRSYPSNVYSVS